MAVTMVGAERRSYDVAAVTSLAVSLDNAVVIAMTIIMAAAVALVTQWPWA